MEDQIGAIEALPDFDAGSCVASSAGPFGDVDELAVEADAVVVGDHGGVAEADDLLQLAGGGRYSPGRGGIGGWALGAHMAGMKFAKEVAINNINIQ